MTKLTESKELQNSMDVRGQLLAADAKINYNDRVGGAACEHFRKVIKLVADNVEILETLGYIIKIKSFSPVHLGGITITVDGNRCFDEKLVSLFFDTFSNCWGYDINDGFKREYKSVKERIDQLIEQASVLESEEMQAYLDRFAVNGEASTDAEIDKIRVIFEAELLKNGAVYEIGENRERHLIATSRQIHIMHGQMEDMYRIKRLAAFEAWSKKLVEESVGTPLECAVANQCASDRQLAYDAELRDGSWRLLASDEFIEHARGVMNISIGAKRALITFDKLCKERQIQHEKIKDIKWEPIDFVGNFRKYLESPDGLNGELDTTEKLKELYGAIESTEPSKPDQKGEIKGIDNREVGSTANHQPPITNEWINLIEILIGQNIPTGGRLSAAHFAYSPDGNLSAIMLTLVPSTRIGDKLAGTFILKADGKRIFLPDITWKQYPTVSPNGRIVVTFQGGPSRGIFDEDVFYATGEMYTSTGDVTFYDGTHDTSEDDYIWRNGNVTRKDSVTRSPYAVHYQIIPKAVVKYDESNNWLVYELDIGRQVL